MEDSQILDLYFARSEDAIAHTQKKYGAMLLALSRRITEDDRDAQECVNDTYWEAWRRIPPIRPEHFGAFLTKIARHISLNRCQMRHAAKRSALMVELSQELEQCVAGQSDAVDLDNQALRDAIERFLRSLDDTGQYIFVRRYFFGESLEEIGKRTGRSENNLASVLFRIRNKLRQFLKKEGITL